MELNKCKDNKIWDDFVLSSLQGSVFCKTDFLNSLDVDYELWFVEKKSVPKAAVIILKDSKGRPIKQPYSFTPYLGLLFDANITSLPSHQRVNESLKLIDFMLAGLENIYDLISFSLSPKFEDLRSILWFHYHQTEKSQFKTNLNYTGLIDLVTPNNFEEYLNGINKSKRYEYRKAKKQGMTIELSKDINLIEKLYVLTFERQDIAVKSKTISLMRNVIQIAISQGYGELFICRDKYHEAISATFFLHDEHTAYYLIGANHPDYRQTGSGIYLLLENIKHYQSLGISKVDVCGVNSPNRGGFKTSLNAVPTPYYIATWDSKLSHS